MNSQVWTVLFMVIQNKKFPWRQALALFLAFLVCTALWAQARQDLLADKVLRLHVMANSDSEADQTLKLLVRDRVLAEVRPLLAGVTSAAEANAVLSACLPALTAAAADEIEKQGYTYPVTVTLEDVWFPTRTYDAAALPAGTYRALRVVIGSGAGHNWWCVVFPSLCLPAAGEASLQAAGLSGEDIALITEATPGYVFRFKTIEWWESLKHSLS